MNHKHSTAHALPVLPPAMSAWRKLACLLPVWPSRNSGRQRPVRGNPPPRIDLEAGIPFNDELTF